MWVKTYDVAKVALDSYCNEKFGRDYDPDHFEKSELKLYCSELDQCSEEFRCSGIDADVDSRTGDLAITLMCNKFVWHYVFENKFYFPTMCKDVIITSSQNADNCIDATVIFDGKTLILK